jgi:hypothetical protein
MKSAWPYQPLVGMRKPPMVCYTHAPAKNTMHQFKAWPRIAMERNTAAGIKRLPKRAVLAHGLTMPQRDKDSL